MSTKDIFLAHGFELSDTEEKLFEKFLSLFIEYNSHTNLSAIRDEEGIVEKHFIDSLYWANVISDLLSENPKAKLLDIGSGGWFPGIPLKIVIPELEVTLLDSVWKKVKAMNHFVEWLWLKQIIAIQDRAENLAKLPDHHEKYDIITSRATAYITDILTWAVPFLAPNGSIILYKMPSEEEVQDREKILKKLHLILVAELEYTLAGKVRILSIFRKK